MPSLYLTTIWFDLFELLNYQGQMRVRVRIITFTANSELSRTKVITIVRDPLTLSQGIS